jgi:hypothetical protein
MQFASTTKHRLKLTFILIFSSASFLMAQENSPYSRYGLGDFFYGNHIIGRGMGNISATYLDGKYNQLFQSVNINNPATYSSFNILSYDLGLTVDSRTLKRANPNAKFSSTNFTPSYLALGMPINRKKNLGFAFGIRPVSRIAYNIDQRTKVLGVDSINNHFEGSGGLSEGFIGVGKRWKGLSVGANLGYRFGNKETISEKQFISDTLFYYPSRAVTNSNFGGAFINIGLQYEKEIGTKKDKANNIVSSLIRFGAHTTLNHTLSGKQDNTKETFTLSGTGTTITIDSIIKSQNISGSISVPNSYTVGLAYVKRVTFESFGVDEKPMYELWSIAAEYSATQWNKFRNSFETTNPAFNSWQFRIGGQLMPDVYARNYWSQLTYRAGFFTGKDYINADGKQLNLIGASFGAAFPIRKWRSYDRQAATIQTAFEFGKRGSKINNYTENFLRISVGFSLSDIWFQKRKYD